MRNFYAESFLFNSADMSDFLEDTNTSQQQVAQNSLNNPVINVTQRKNSDVGLIAGKCQLKKG